MTVRDGCRGGPDSQPRPSLPPGRFVITDLLPQNAEGWVCGESGHVITVVRALPARNTAVQQYVPPSTARIRGVFPSSSTDSLILRMMRMLRCQRAQQLGQGCRFGSGCTVHTVQQKPHVFWRQPTNLTCASTLRFCNNFGILASSSKRVMS